MSDADAVLEFWFGDCADDAAIYEDKQSLWWGGGDDLDQQILDRFGELHRRACSGELDSWASTAHGRLALILLLDQFSRNICRGRPEAFKSDPKAVALVVEGIAMKQNRELSTARRQFFYMPLMHSEQLAHHDQAVVAFEQLVADAPEELKQTCSGTLSYEHKHRDLIVRFGRYPHRNEILGREPNPDEVAYLAEGGETFGQKK